MTGTADMLVERRRLRRRLAFWRVIAILAVIIAALVALAREGAAPLGAHIARVRIEGLITDDPRRSALLARLADSGRVVALMVDINSPGGTVAGSEALYADLRRVAAKKPVVAVMSEVAASGGYITALAADHIVARGNTLTGSIGVVAEIPNIKGLLDKVGVEVTRVKSAPLKGEPSLTEPPSEESLAVQRALISDAYAWFKHLVAERRALAPADLEKVADGRVLSGRQALAAHLIDAIGGEEAARKWLSENRGIDADLRVVDYDWHNEALPWPLDTLGKSIARTLGVSLTGTPVVSPWPRLYAVMQR